MKFNSLSILPDMPITIIIMSCESTSFFSRNRPMEFVIHRVLCVLNHWDIPKNPHCAQFGVIILHIEPLLDKFYSVSTLPWHPGCPGRTGTGVLRYTKTMFHFHRTHLPQTPSTHVRWSIHTPALTLEIGWHRQMRASHRFQAGTSGRLRSKRSRMVRLFT